MCARDRFVTFADGKNGRRTGRELSTIRSFVQFRLGHTGTGVASCDNYGALEAYEERTHTELERGAAVSPRSGARQALALALARALALTLDWQQSRGRQQAGRHERTKRNGTNAATQRNERNERTNAIRGEQSA